jgi:hypothetical protein
MELYNNAWKRSISKKAREKYWNGLIKFAFEKFCKKMGG